MNGGIIGIMRTPQRRTGRLTSVLGVAIGLLVLPALTAAQQPNAGGVARSGMGQGNASVTTRSDVRMSVESGGTTSRARIQLIGNAIGTKMAAIRQCYADVVSQRPNVTGQLKVRVELVRGQRTARVEMFDDRAHDATLTRCILRAIRSVSLRTIEAPAIAIIVLDLDNSAARGVAVTQRRAEESRAQSRVTRGADGAMQATGATLGGEVRFTVTAQGGGSEVAVDAVQRGLMTGIAPLRDCRRRAGRHGQSPAGELVIDLRVPAQGSRRATSV